MYNVFHHEGRQYKKIKTQGLEFVSILVTGEEGYRMDVQ